MWNVRPMNQSKLAVKTEMSRLNTDILGINGLKWTEMGDFTSEEFRTFDEHKKII